jgi:hypothetical protein
MKKLINYFYNLYPETIDFKDNKYFFSMGSDNYYLMESQPEEIKKAFNLYMLLVSSNIYVHALIKTVNNLEYITDNNKVYALIKTGPLPDEKVNLITSLYYANATLPLNLKTKDNMRLIWLERIDYFEYELGTNRSKYPIILDSAAYYLGLAENSVQLLLDVKIDFNLVISHKRMKKDYTALELYNPLELMIDNRVRDAAEYFKDKFFTANTNIDEIKIYFQNNQLNNYEYLYFFARMLYPNYYFDLCADIIYFAHDESKLNNLINKIEPYEILLKELYAYMRTLYVIPEIEWLR